MTNIWRTPTAKATQRANRSHTPTWLGAWDVLRPEPDPRLAEILLAHHGGAWHVLHGNVNSYPLRRDGCHRLRQLRSRWGAGHPLRLLRLWLPCPVQAVAPKERATIGRELCVVFSASDRKRVRARGLDVFDVSRCPIELVPLDHAGLALRVQPRSLPAEDHRGFTRR